MQFKYLNFFVKTKLL